MRRLRTWLNEPSKLTPREAEMLTAGAYLAGWLLAAGWDTWQQRRARSRAIDAELRQLFEDFHARLTEMADEEKGGNGR